MKKTIALSSVLFCSLCVVGCSKKNAAQIANTTHADTMHAVNTTPPAVPPNPPPQSAPAFDAKNVSIHNLPDSVHPFVAKYYPGYAIAAATYDPLCGGAPAMDIAIRAKGKPAYSVIFLPNGHYVQREQDVPLSSIPATVRAAVKQTFAGYRPGLQAESLQLVDGTMEYSVDLNKPHNNKEAIFSASGQVLCQGPQ